MSEPLAYLLTWTCYGTWLHGDTRGSVDAEHNTPGAPLAPPNPRRQSISEKKMRRDACRLSDTARLIVSEIIVDHCELRGWTLHAANVRSNHVHVVVSCDVAPASALSQLKAWATRRLRENGHRGADEPVWAEGGSRRYLWTRESLHRAIDYVGEYQGDGVATGDTLD
jgi:REP element-mobilizing transposase RayT